MVYKRDSINMDLATRNITSKCMGFGMQSFKQKGPTFMIQDRTNLLLITQCP
jgi:hypothetical protein